MESKSREERNEAKCECVNESKGEQVARPLEEEHWWPFFFFCIELAQPKLNSLVQVVAKESKYHGACRRLLFLVKQSEPLLTEHVRA